MQFVIFHKMEFLKKKPVVHYSFTYLFSWHKTSASNACPSEAMQQYLTAVSTWAPKSRRNQLIASE